MPDKRAHIHYSGAVQGVGFRISTERLAGSLGIKGWVRNLEDGRVEVLCEGKEEDIGLFMTKLYSIFKRYISGTDIEWASTTDEFEGFEIKHY